METRIEIILDVQGKKYYLDTNGTDTIPLTYNIAKIQDISVTQGSYSKTIVVPETAHNRQIFSNITDLNSESSFNPNLRNRAYILVDGIMVIDGYFQLTDYSVYDKNTHFNTLSLLVFSDNNDFYTVMEEKLLEDLDLTRFNHLYNYDNIKNSWYNPTTFQERDYQFGYYYPLIDNGYDWSITDINGSVPIGSQTASTVMIEQLKPALYARTIWDEIFKEAGFTWTSTSLEATGFNNMIVPFNNNILTKSDNDINKNYFRVGMNSDVALNLATKYAFKTSGLTGNYLHVPTGVIMDETDTGSILLSTTIPFNNSTGTGYTDPNNMFNTSTYKYVNTSSEPQTMAFNLSLIIKELFFYSLDHLPEIQAYRSMNPGTGVVKDQWGYPFVTDTGSNSSPSCQISVPNNWIPVIGATYPGVKEDMDVLKVVYDSTSKLYITQSQHYQAFEYNYKSFKTEEITIRPGEEIFFVYKYTLTGRGDEELVQNPSSPVYQIEPYAGYIPGHIGWDSAYYPSNYKNNILYLNVGRNVANILATFTHNSTTYNSFIYSIPAAEIKANQTIEMDAVIPKEIKQRDYVLSIIKMFNLYVEPDKLNPKNLLIETRDAFYNTNKVIKDWTKKVDMNEAPQVTVLADTQNKRYLFKYKDDKDWMNTQYLNAFNLTFGEKIYTQENEMAISDKTLEIIFSPTPITSLGKTTTDGQAGSTASFIILPKIQTVSNNVISSAAFNIRILNKKWIPLDQKDYWILNIGPTSSTATQSTFVQQVGYPYTGYLDDPHSPSFDINYDVVNPFYPSTNTTTNTLYKMYWEQQILETTDRDSRIVTTSLYLTPEDIYNFKFSDNIFIDFGDGGQYYKVNKIDYDPTLITTSVVELIKTREIAVPKPPTKPVQPAKKTPWVWHVSYTPHFTNNLYDDSNSVYDGWNTVQGSWNSVWNKNNIINGYHNTVYGTGNHTIGSWNNIGSSDTYAFGQYNTTNATTNNAYINGSYNALSSAYNVKITGNNNVVKPAIGTNTPINNVYIIGNNQTVTKSNVLSIGTTMIVSPNYICASKDEILSPFSQNIFPNYISGSKDKVREWGSQTNIMMIKAGRNAVLSDAAPETVIQ